MRSSYLPYCLPTIGEEEIAEVVDSLRKGWLTTGPKVHQFEEAFAAYVGAKHALAVNSCTSALHVALAAAGIGPGDEVIVPTLTFCATANVVVHLGATPVLADVDESGHLTAAAIEAKITPRTRAVIPVHYAGESCDLDEILSLGHRRRFRVIEDAAHAAGTRYRGRPIGAHGDAVCFSFYATKNMTTGEGGMVTTNNADLAARMRLLSLHGMSHDAWNRYSRAGTWRYEVLEPGFKYNMGELQAALGIHQLKRLDAFAARRRKIAHRYNQELSRIPGLVTPGEKPDREHVFHLYPIWLNAQHARISRDGLIEKLRAANIGTSVHFIPLHRHPVFRERLGCREESFPVAEKLFRGLISLPLYPGMSDTDVDDVIDAVQSAMRGQPVREEVTAA